HNLLSATVIAANSTIADAYATYLMVIGFDEAKNFLEKNTHFDAILVYGDQDKMKVYSTKGVKLAE
ncbi:MAG: FAD:protein FMN transferase, partial [Bacteroidales bacterium]|nr:FAD:protein FMN transferase [Bacteroidales bacterium]